MPPLHVAAASVPLRCDDSWVIAGSIQPGRATGQQGELRAAALVLRADVSLCFVACDVLCVTRDLADRAARAIESACAVPFDHVLITASHTHHAPSAIETHAYGPEPAFCQQLEGAIVAAAQQAAAHLDENKQKPNAVEAELGFALGQEATVGINSRLLLKDGTVAWCGHDPAEVVRPTGPFDPDLPVIAFRRPEGQLAALLFSHSTHNIGRCGPGGRSPGFYGIAAQELEQAHGAAALFLPGAFGSTHSNRVPDIEAKTRIRAAVEEALGRLDWGLRGPVAAVRREHEFRVRHFDEAAEDAAVSYYCRRWWGAERAQPTIDVFRSMRKRLAPRQGEVRRTWLQVVRLGEVVLVGVPGEMFAALGLAIRRRSPFRHTFVVGLANDEIGYIPDQSGFDHGGYQVWTGFHSLLERGEGERMVDALLGMLEEVHAGPPPGAARIAEPVLRDLREGDAAALQAFYNAFSPAARRLFRPLGWNTTLASCDEVCSAVAAGSRYDVVLEAGGQIVGWAFLGDVAADVPHLGIGIADAFVGRGFGRRLMQALINRARAAGRKGIELCHVADNKRAHRLYQSCGFRVTGTSRGPDGLDYLKMALTL